jgi:hypothetical protein
MHVILLPAAPKMEAAQKRLQGVAIRRNVSIKYVTKQLKIELG